LLLNKTNEVVLGIISEVLEWIKNIKGSYPLRFHYDSTLEGNQAKTFFKNKGIELTTTNPKTLKQNGSSERFISIFLVRLKATIYNFDIPKNL